VHLLALQGFEDFEHGIPSYQDHGEHYKQASE
jgi:hypothetical protein